MGPFESQVEHEFRLGTRQSMMGVPATLVKQGVTDTNIRVQLWQGDVYTVLKAVDLDVNEVIEMAKHLSLASAEKYYELYFK